MIIRVCYNYVNVLIIIIELIKGYAYTYIEEFRIIIGKKNVAIKCKNVIITGHYLNESVDCFY